VNPGTFSAAGDFRGVEQRLDYLKDLGVTILWIMPIDPVGQAKKKGSIGSAYAVQDYYAINPSLWHEGRIQTSGQRNVLTRPEDHHRHRGQPNRLG
jgi:glycosidase